MERILVTGGTGLVGSAIKSITHNDNTKIWHFLSSKDVDLRCKQKTMEVFSKIQPTTVIHLAANVGGLFKNMKEKVKMFTENIEMNNNVLQACAEYKVKKVLTTLSTCVFPDSIEYPFDESSLHNGPPHPSNEGYAYAKRMLEVASRIYREEYGIQFINIIPTNIFGPNDNFNLDDAHVVPALIHRTYLAKLKGEKLVVGGTGKPIRQFIYSIDLAKIILYLLDNYTDEGPVIITSDEEISISEVAHSIADAFQFPTSQIEFDTSRADGQMRKTANNAKLKSFVPTLQFTPFSEAIRVTCDWFESNYETSRK